MKIKNLTIPAIIMGIVIYILCPGGAQTSRHKEDVFDRLKKGESITFLEAREAFMDPGSAKEQLEVKFHRRELTEAQIISLSNMRNYKVVYVGDQATSTTALSK